MRVGANVRQFHRIKKMHAEGVPADVIANSIPLTPQSLEKILAHMDGRAEVVLAVEENAEVQALRLQVAEQAQKLARFEEPTDGAESEAEKVKVEETVEGGEKVEDSEEVSAQEST
jgi:predicted RND superfamily exporter protein